MNDALLQYGALGACVIGLGLAVRTLFSRMAASADAERARADRNEAELKKLNETIQERILPVLVQATTVLSDVLKAQQRDHG